MVGLGAVLQDKPYHWLWPIKIEKNDQMEDATDHKEDVSCLLSRNYGMKFKEIGVDSWNFKEEIKTENYFIEEDGSYEDSSLHLEKIENNILKINLKSEVEKCGSFMAAGNSFDGIHREHLTFKCGTHIERERHISCRDNIVLKISNEFSRRKCCVSLSKLKLDDFSCDRCYLYFSSLDTKNCHTCTCKVIADISKESISLNHLMNENKFNEQIKKFHCLQCSKSFHYKYHLNSHVFSVHKKIKNKKCSQCESKFSSNYELKYHIFYVHTKRKIYHCHKCPASFCRKGHLTQHCNYVHDKLKLHNCPKCPSAFHTTFDLDRHNSSVHLKLQLYQCMDCSKSFARKNSLIRHIDSVHSNLRNYSCAKCDSTFNRKDCLQNHLKLKHN